MYSSILGITVVLSFITLSMAWCRQRGSTLFLQTNHVAKQQGCPSGSIMQSNGGKGEDTEYDRCMLYHLVPQKAQ